VKRGQSRFHAVRAVIAIVLVIACNTSAVAAQPQSSKEQDEAIALARKTAAERLSIAADQFRVVLVSPAQWRDSSLGCPQRGQVYAQVLTSGFKITLRESDREHTVHVAGGRALLCGTQPDARLSPAPRMASAIAAGNAVRTHISRTMRIPESRIRVVSVKAARRGDACVPATVAGAGSIVETRVDGKTVRYYRDDAVITACDAK
jgi:hypothetical protein